MIQILLIEDDDANAEFVKRAFEKYSDKYCITITNNLVNASELLKNTKPDLVITNMLLPDGKRTRLLHSESEIPNFPMIVMSSYGDEQTAVKAIKDGALDYFVMAVDTFTELPRIVERVLREWQHITERVQAETELAKSRERMELALRGSELGMWDWDIEKNRFTLDTKTEELFGSFSNNLDGWLSRIHPDDVEIVRAFDKAIIEGKSETIDNDYRFISETGEIRWIKGWGRVVEWDKEGKPIRAAGTSLDITEQKKTEEAYKESERNLKRAQSISKIGSWYYDWVNGTEVWSDECFKIFGVKKKKNQNNIVSIGFILGKTYANPEESSKLFKSLAEKHDTFKYEYTTVSIDGEVKTICSYCEVERDGVGNIIKVFGTDHDITDRKQTEVELSVSRERLELALKGADLGMWDWDIVKDDIIFDDKSEILVGFVPRNSKDWYKSVHPEDLNKVKEIDEAVIKGQSEVIDYDYRILLESGENRWIRAWGRITEWNNDGKPIRATGTNQDITEKKEMEEALKKSHDDLEIKVAERTRELKESLNILEQTQNQLIRSERLAALGNMVAGIAHEINTPLGICVTESSFLNDKTQEIKELFTSESLTSSYFQKYLKLISESPDSIFKNLNRSAELIRSFKQVAVDQTTTGRREFLVKEYVDGVILSLKSKIKRTNHKIIVKCSEELAINSYPGALAQITTNLIMNSLTHGLEDINQGKIKFEIYLNNQYLVFNYSDNGIGMDTKTLKQIFDPFFTTKRNQGGTGLGMHITYNLVTQKLNGKISCNSSLAACRTIRI
jgi:PAS domain S-box-containing protein